MGMSILHCCMLLAHPPPHDFSTPNLFISLLKPNPYFVRPPSFFFSAVKSILRQTPIIFFLRRQIHTLFKPHDFSASNPFISLLISNPSFVSPPSFLCLNFFYFFILAKSMLRSNPMIFLLQVL